MKNTMKKGLLFLVLAVLTAGGVFAQRVGDTVDFYGQKYDVKEIKDGRVVLQLAPSLDGTWQRPDGLTVTFNGNNGLYKQFSSYAFYQDAVKKGYLKVGDQMFINLKKTSGLTWSGQVKSINRRTNAPDVAIGILWTDTTITLSADGKTFTEYGTTWTRQ